MAKKAITSLDANPLFFSGQSMLLIFDKVTDYSAATLASIIDGTPQYVGNIEADSTTPGGDAGSPTEVSNEQGQVVISNPGTSSTTLSFTVMSTSQAAVSTFLGGTALDSSANGTTADSITGLATAYGAKSGYAIERPIAVVSKSGDQMILFPKAQIVSTLAGSPGLSGYMNISVTATALSTGNIKLDSVIFTKNGEPMSL